MAQKTKNTTKTTERLVVNVTQADIDRFERATKSGITDLDRQNPIANAIRRETKTKKAVQAFGDVTYVGSKVLIAATQRDAERMLRFYDRCYFNETIRPAKFTIKKA